MSSTINFLGKQTFLRKKKLNFWLTPLIAPTVLKLEEEEIWGQRQRGKANKEREVVIAIDWPLNKSGVFCVTRNSLLVG